MSIRNLTEEERKKVDKAWSTYLDLCESNPKDAQQHWNNYQAVLQSINVIATFMGYQVREDDK